ncbi:hypothetical protein C0993_002862 [Termitomyces sp. T159_Od127]|nr:hypothetical protein C0993_002862 [Termitomyces sp. T159_Od127]
MSDDEDCYDNDGKLVPGRYISRPPVYRTDILNEFYQALDAVPDPDQSIKYTLRIQGEPKDYKPPHANSIKNKARRWMVCQEWLDLNPVNKACDKLLADSGQLWGDTNDPEELEARQKRAQEEKSEVRRKKLKVEEVEAKKVNVKEKKKKGKGKGKEKVQEVAKDDSDEFTETTDQEGSLANSAC